MRRTLELFVVAILCAGSLWLGKLLYHNYWEHPRNEAASAPNVAPDLLVGRSTDGEVAVVRLTEPGEPTLLLMLSTECPYCEQTLPMWREILDAADRAGRQGIRTMVLSTSPPTDTLQYLEANGLGVSSTLLIGREELAALGASGVPTTALVRPADRTFRRWTGVLDGSEVEEIIALLRATAAQEEPVPAEVATGF